jgi:PAS domain S-box-containing protein
MKTESLSGITAGKGGAIMANGKYTSTEMLETAQLLKRKRAEIHQVWVDRLKNCWGEEGHFKIDILAQAEIKNQDPLSLLIRQIAGRVKDRRKEIKPMLDKVRGEHYTLVDFLQEIECLEDAVEEALKLSQETTEVQILRAMNHVRKTLGSYSRAVTQETSGIYEKIVECGARGYCLFDEDGVIVTTNVKMDSLLGTSSAVGKALNLFLKKEDRTLLQDVMSSFEEGKISLGKLTLHQPAGHKIIVGAEMGPAFVRGERRGGYLCAVDLSHPVRQELDMFNRFPLGVIKLNLDGKFTYMNPVALQLLGIDHFEGKTIRDVFPDKENYSKVKEKISKREKLESDDYEVVGTRWVDGVKVPIRVTAMPELGLQGNVVGSLALVRDITEEKVTENISEYLSSTMDCKEILKNTATAVASLVPFDFFIVTLYSKDMIHLRKYFSCGPAGEISSDIRWWEISEPLRDMVRDREISVISNYEAYLDEPSNRHLANLREFQFLRTEKFVSSIRYPIVQDGQVIAAITFLSKRGKTYGEEHKRLIKGLPLEKIVLRALQEEKTKDQNMRHELVGEIVTKYTEVDKVVIDNICARYPWDHVSLFLIDEINREFRLLRQRARGKAKPLPDGYTQSLSEGVLGYVYESRTQVLIQDTWQDPAFQDMYLDAIGGMKAELCIPILFRDKVRWLLNIEDSNKNAFSVEEEASLADLVQIIRDALYRSWNRSVLEAAMKSASDIIFVTDGMGRIDRHNKEAIERLGYSAEQMSRLTMKMLFDDPSAAGDVLEFSKSIPREVNLLAKDKKKYPVLLSASALPEEFGGNVVICKDLTLYKRVEELEYLKKMYHEIAIQTKIPLSLAFGWIERLHDGIEDRGTAEILDKTLSQLRKLELTYNRLALYERNEEQLPYNEVMINIRSVVAQLLSRLPGAEYGKVTFRYTGPSLYLKGDPFQLTFCLEAILSFLLRYLPSEEKIDVSILKKNKRIITKIAGFLPRLDEPRSEETGTLDNASYTLMQMALGDEMIKQFVRNHRGQYVRRRGKGLQEVFEIQLPAA